MGGWGDCSLDRAVEGVVSPHPYDTAQDHYNALLAEAEAAGGPTVTHDNHCPTGTDGMTAALTWSSGFMVEIYRQQQWYLS